MYNLLTRLSLFENADFYQAVGFAQLSDKLPSLEDIKIYLSLQMIQKPSVEKGSLSDKDLQLLKRTFLKLTELYYESPKNEPAINDLINLATLLTQTVTTSREADALSLISTLEILKLKSKGCPSLLVAVEATLVHLRDPIRRPLQYPSLLYSLQRPEIFIAGCTLAVRFFDRLPGETDWKELLGELSRNISVSPSLCLQLVYLACKENETVARAAVRSGIVKYVLLSHIAATLADKYHLYQSIKLLKAVSSAERSLLRDRQRQLALIIYTYEDYIPLIQQICNRCYDQDYCAAIDGRRRYDQNTIDQPYLWSYTESYSTRTLSEETTTQLVRSLQNGLPEDRETKTYAILANYSKFRKVPRKDALQVLPKSPRALLNFVKVCVACGEADSGSLAGLDLNSLQGLIEKSQSPKVEQLFKYLKELKQKGTTGGVGVLSDSVRKLFSMEKNADFLMERASKIPQNTQQLADIRQILKQKDRTNQFESDTLRAVKERALASLHAAVSQRRKLDLSGVLKDVQLTDVKLLGRLLQTLELALTMNQDLIELIPTGRVLEIIQWIEDHYNGELIEWSAVGQLLAILTGEQEWRKRLSEVPEKSFWLLAVNSPQSDAEDQLMRRVDQIKKVLGKAEGKVPFIVGFLRGLTREQKLIMLKRFPEFFQLLLKNLRENSNYKTTLLMLAGFLKDWHSESSESNKVFEENIVAPTVAAVLANFRSLDQEHQVLQSCLPYKISTERLADCVESLVGQHGRLASYVYRDCLQKGSKVNIGYDRIRTVGRLPPEKSRQALEILTFLQENGQLLQDDELTPLLEGLSARKLAYWLIYPNFYNTLSRVITILSRPCSPAVLKNLSSILFKLMALLNSNSDISEDERRDLLMELIDCMKEIGKRGEILQKDRLRRATEKVTEEDIKKGLNQIIDSLPESKPQPQPQSPQAPKSPENKPLPQPSKQEEIIHSEQKHEDPGNTAGLQDLQRREEPFNIDKHLQPGKQSEGGLMQALRDLKRIIEKELPEQTFLKLNEVFLNQSFREEHKDMLGYLLVKFYPARPEPFKALARDLIARKDKTYLSKESCYELLSKHKEAFVLARRWKLTGRDWLDLALQRMREGFYGIGSQIAEYNLPRSADLEYFFAKKYHEVTLGCFSKVEDADDLAYYMVLVGTSARMPQIKKAFVKEKLHIRILQAYSRFPDNLKLIGNLSYALSALAYVQPDVCLQVARQKQEISLLLQKYGTHWDNRPIVESGACLLANLAYSNQEVKEMLRQLGCSEVLLSILEKLLDRPEVTTFKQVLRALGNLSLSSKCAQEIIDGRFCALAVLMMERLDIFVQMDEKKAALMKILIDLIANLASHRYRLDIFHKEKLTLAILTMLETTQDHPPILTACIDTIDCLCQNPQIQNYVVTEKRILYLLVDVLKVQTDEKIVVKSTRLLTNLTINPACIPYILQANLLSVLASIVMPHFYGNKLAAEQRKKMETYILKIVTRIYHSKQSKELILRSGYLDCLLRTIQTSDLIEDAYIEILYSYSDGLPNFLNKRAFLCLLRIIARKISNREAIVRSFRIVKTLSNLYQRDEEDILLSEAPQMYEKLLASNEFREQGLFLLAYHLLRSYKLRQALQKRTDHVLQMVKQLADDSKLADLARQVFFIAFNPYSALREWQGTELGAGMEQAYQALRGGFKCSLFRMDGSSKKAVVDINEQYELRAYKFPGGQIKKKYVINIKNLKDFQFCYPVTEELWANTVFSVGGGGLFDSHKAVPQNCCSLIGSGKWGELSFINLEFDSEEQKNKFYRSVSLVFHSVR